MRSPAFVCQIVMSAALLISSSFNLNANDENLSSEPFITNQQTPLFGSQYGFVNVGKGNVTFAQNDIAQPNRIPLNLTRVYDSSITTTGDFGIGWHLALAETIHPTNSTQFIYTDAHANHLTLDAQGKTLVPRHQSLTEIKSAVKVNQHIVLRFNNGWNKTFTLIDDVYRLSEMVDNHSNQLKLHYKNNYLVEIKAANRLHLVLTRDKQNRVIQASSSFGQVAKYQYRHNNLVKVSTTHNENWSYQYNNAGLLTSAGNQDTLDIAQFSYNPEQKAISSSYHAGKFNYAHQANVTEVSQGLVNIQFKQNPQGITTEIINSIGGNDKLMLNQQQQITELHQNGQLAATYHYKNNHLTHVNHYTNDGKLAQQVEFGPNSQNTRISGNINAAYHYDHRGDLISRNDNNGFVFYGYNYSGDIISITQNGNSSTFSYNAYGQVRTVTAINNGERMMAKIRYDAHGHVADVNYSDNHAVSYLYRLITDKQPKPSQVIGLNSYRLSAQTQLQDIATRHHNMVNMNDNSDISQLIEIKQWDQFH